MFHAMLVGHHPFHHSLGGKMSIKCGNPIHKPDVVYHDTTADVRECYLGRATAADAAVQVAAMQPSPGAWKRGDPLPFPEGRYAILADDSLPEHVNETVFLKVDAPDEGRWAGYVFVKVQVSDELHNVRSRPLSEAYVNAIINQGWKQCLLRYGQEIGVCGHCGRTLTNDESRAYGIGPVCRRDPRLAI
jgi:hypothetical protein